VSPNAINGRQRRFTAVIGNTQANRVHHALLYFRESFTCFGQVRDVFTAPGFANQLGASSTRAEGDVLRRGNEIIQYSRRLRARSLRGTVFDRSGATVAAPRVQVQRQGSDTLAGVY
jgi:hypothetical protein